MAIDLNDVNITHTAPLRRMEVFVKLIEHEGL